LERVERGEINRGNLSRDHAVKLDFSFRSGA